MATLVTVAYRQLYAAATAVNGELFGFRIFGFIDNTINAMCRPGGGPLKEGEQAPRLSKDVQETWWTGWKKLHGLKWQTISLPNGMEFHVWGPLSVRRNDNHMLNRSQILQQLEDLQAENEIKFILHGDSAYSEDDYMHVGGGRGFASVRQSIEWNYKDIKTQWKYCDYKHALKLHNQPLSKIFLVCILLRNAYTTMNACETALFFNCPAPDFETWIAQGPKGRPIPDDSIFKDIN
jgi:hypothetical protein